ncbi:tRNA pseudouridine(55) synthase TruB [Methylophilaceae bacterium]|nr:tRNA pseudouridine(55) synthase TruB [Methylophilaceae bacterium]|tara:strand:- start:3098 stop:3997 length:900 start_codon:yes stop_codon:yes gene_type:complete
MIIKSPKQEINGLLIIDKPLGFSSNQTLSKIKWLYNPKKAGHTGTLDPLATGILPVCLGEATKFSSYLFDANKTYAAKIKLGFTSSTADAEGTLKDLNIVKFPNKTKVTNVLKTFEGAIEQTPPMYSALKHDGKPLYEYARQGIQIPRKKRIITIFSIKLINLEKDELILEINCSKGTYIRTLAEDIGEKLKVGGYLSSLRRTVVGSLTINDAITLDSIEESLVEDRFKFINPIDRFLNNFDSLIVSNDEASAIKDGKIVHKKEALQSIYRLYTQENFFIGLAEGDAKGNLKVKRLMAI